VTRVATRVRVTSHESTALSIQLMSESCAGANRRNTRTIQFAIWHYMALAKAAVCGLPPPSRQTLIASEIEQLRNAQGGRHHLEFQEVTVIPQAFDQSLPKSIRPTLTTVDGNVN